MVQKVYSLQSDHCRLIRFAYPGETEGSKIQTTDEHLFWVDGKGWIQAVDIPVGSWLLDNEANRVQVVANDPISGAHPVCAIKLKGDVAFYAERILVHDICQERAAELDLEEKNNLQKVEEPGNGQDSNSPVQRSKPAQRETQHSK